MVSKASDDLPEPLTPVITISDRGANARSTFFRLCVRAPRTTMCPLRDPVVDAMYCERFGGIPELSMVAQAQQPINLGSLTCAILLGLVVGCAGGGPPVPPRDRTKRGLCQSVCLSGTCRTPPTKPSCGSTCR